MVGWRFETVPANIDETRAQSEDAVTYVRRLAQSKAESVAASLSSGLVLGADTAVVVEGEILGQPRDREDAARMLNLLSGRWHEVLTGVALIRAGIRAGTRAGLRVGPGARQINQSLVDCEVTRVRFGAMSEAEINWYVATGEPMDKAGAYAIQGKAALFIEEVQGDYFNIVGLPVRLVYELAQRI